jgi:hypothetical protein
MRRTVCSRAIASNARAGVLSRAYSPRALHATRPKATAMSTCHSHQDACQLWAKAIAIIDSASSANAAATARATREGRSCSRRA